MRIAILGATSQIARDLIQSFSTHNGYEWVLYARRPQAVTQWLANIGLSTNHTASTFATFMAEKHFDAILNFVGVSDPAQVATMGAAIFDVTSDYDGMALHFLKHHPACRYIFLSSGAAYGTSFDVPVDINTQATVSINNLQPQDWYGAAKLHAECRHRALAHLPIVDVRVFNYFSRSHDLASRFFITDVLRSIRDQTTLYTTPDYMRRDFLGPQDFHQLISRILSAPAQNLAIDCYTQAQIDKQEILSLMQQHFGLRYEIGDTPAHAVNATGHKPHYYSLSRRADDFGYRPQRSSADNLVKETSALLAPLIGH